MLKTLRPLLIVTAGTVAVLCIALLAIPLPDDAMHPPSSLRVLDRNGETLRVYLASDDSYCLPVSLDRMSPDLKRAFLNYEDRFFYYHPGINVVSTMRALWMNVRAGEVLSGGSTITQQLARMIEQRDRTIAAKAIEAFRALQLEIRYSKDELFTAYLNRAPFGGNIVGVEAAAQVYFGKHAAELGPGEAALLTAIPKSPTRLRPDVNPVLVRERRDEVLRRMHQRDVIDGDQLRLALAERIADSRLPFPLHAPHLCDQLYQRYGLEGGDLLATIDLPTQRIANRLLQRHVSGLRSRGIENGAVVVIENETGSLLALAGSADYFSEATEGQVNGAAAARSPGSTLKPFVYALALDNGRLSPLSLIEDIPVSYTGYSPLNYDGLYRGMVPTRDALAHSLNIPAVNTLNEIGLTSFFNLLREGGITTLDKGPQHYGLPLVLGGAGIRLDELTNLYATLARLGEYQPLRVLESQPAGRSTSLLSSGASYLVADILTDVTRPDFPSAWQASRSLPKIAWKTGTSYGHRDAWSIGFTPRYTIGVWLGNFSGEGVPALVGADAAGPLLFDLFSALEAGRSEWYAQPIEVIERDVCALSGMPASNGCKEIVQEKVLAGRTPGQRCTFHVDREIDSETGYRLCPLCRSGKHVRHEVAVVWPPRVASWRRTAGLSLDNPPLHNPDCMKMTAQYQPQILSPEGDVEYIIRASAPIEDQQIQLNAAVAEDVSTVYWFVNDELVYSGPPQKKVFWPPRRGVHEAVCVDDEGRRQSRRFIVR